MAGRLAPASTHEHTRDTLVTIATLCGKGLDGECKHMGYEETQTRYVKDLCKEFQDGHKYIFLVTAT